jgi:pimeloyl-ACP methyl ester carboxylesterase
MNPQIAKVEKVRSKDGTIIAFERVGSGLSLILVDGAFGQRAMDSDKTNLAKQPAMMEHFTVFRYDRRGRGESTDTLPFAVQREIEDIEALIDEGGGSAYLYGISSGAALAFEAALALGKKVKKLALYEPPYNDEEKSRKNWVNYRKKLKEVLPDRKGDAVAAFMMLLGMPAEHLEGMRQSPMWPMMEKIAHTLEYDAAAMGTEAAVPVEKAKQVKVPTLVMDGSRTEWPFMHVTAKTLAKTIPNAEHRIVQGQTHEVSAEALAPVLIEFFTKK